MSKSKRKRGEKRLNELRRLAGEAGFEMQEFSAIHVRVFGQTTVDYWPTTGKAWVTGGTKPAHVCEPSEAIALASIPTEVLVAHEEAKSHMQSIMTDDSPPPWE